MTDISSLKIADILGNFPEPAFVTDGDGFVRYVNAATERVTGYPASDILGLPLFRFISEENAQELKDGISRAIYDEIPSSVRALLIKKDESELHVNFTLFPVSAADDGDRACLFLIRDSSPVSLAAADERSFNFLMVALDALKEGVVVTDLSGNISFANPRSGSILGYPPNEIAGLSFGQLFPKSEEDTPREIIDKTVEGGSWEGELTLLQKNGNRVSVRLATLIIRDTKGDPYLMAGIIHDISKEVEMQRELIHINKELTALYSVSTTLSETIELDELLNVSLDKVLQVMGMDKGIIRIVEEESGDLVLKAQAGVSVEYLENYERMSKDDSISGRVVRTGVPYLANKKSGDDPEKDVVLMREGLSQVIIIPLRSKDKTLGTMSVGGYNPRTSTFHDIKLLTSIGNLFGVAIENALIYERADMLAKEKAIKVVELTLLSDLSHALLTTLELDKLLYIVLTTVTMGESFGFNRAALFLVDEVENSIYGRMGVGPISMEDAGRIWSELEEKKYRLQDLVERGFGIHGSPEAIQNRVLRKIKVPLSKTDDVLVKSITENRPIIVRDVKSNPHVDKRMVRLLMGDDEFACVPIVTIERPLGVLLVDNVFNKKPIVEEDVNLLWAFANQAGLAIHNSLMYTNQAKINRELREAQAKLLQQAKLVGLGEMAAEIAHEIRNPLVSVGGFARKLSEHSEGNKQIKRYSDIIVKEVNKLEHTLSNILSLQKDIPSNFEEVDLNAVVLDALNLVGDDLAPRGIEKNIHLDESLPMIEADRSQLHQVFLNLLYNAIQAMEGGGRLDVTTTIQDMGGTKYVRVIVSDTGMGIAPELIGEIFKPFFTTKSTGTGLGLAITHKIITNHGGNIDILNRPEGGATFIVELPIKQE